MQRMYAKNNHPERESMSLYETGRLCVKTAGRDAGLKCIVLNQIDKNYVLVDGQTRRKKCNIAHLEPLPTIISLEKDASPDAVKKACAEAGIEVREKHVAV